MTVYVIRYEDYDGGFIIGVYSSLTSALLSARSYTDRDVYWKPVEENDGLHSNQYFWLACVKTGKRYESYGGSISAEKFVLDQDEE